MPSWFFLAEDVFLFQFISSLGIFLHLSYVLPLAVAFNLFLLDYLPLKPMPCMQAENLYVTNSHLHQPSEPHQPGFHHFAWIQVCLELPNLDSPKESIHVPRGLSEQPLIPNMLIHTNSHLFISTRESKIHSRTQVHLITIYTIIHKIIMPYKNINMKDKLFLLMLAQLLQ